MTKFINLSSNRAKVNSPPLSEAQLLKNPGVSWEEVVLRFTGANHDAAKERYRRFPWGADLSRK